MVRETKDTLEFEGWYRWWYSVYREEICLRGALGEARLATAEPPEVGICPDVWDAEGCWQAGGARGIAGRHQKCDADKICITCWHSCARSKLLFLWIRIWFFLSSPTAHPFKPDLEGFCWVWDRCEQPGLFVSWRSCWVTLWSSASSQRPL